MKNIFILTIIFISSFIPVFSKEEFIYETTNNISSYKVYKTIDFKQENKKAKNIFYKYLLKENNITKKQYKNMCNNSSYCYIKADEIDLNNDGINEIIGYDNMLDCGAMQCIVSVLQKQNNEWNTISSFGIIRGSHIDILEDKNKGYRSIRPNIKPKDLKTALKENYFGMYILKYKDNGYNLIIRYRKEN